MLQVESLNEVQDDSGGLKDGKVCPVRTVMN